MCWKVIGAEEKKGSWEGQSIGGAWMSRQMGRASLGR